MIYLVTKQQRVFDDEIKVLTIEDSLKLLEPLTIVGLDTETTGIDCWTKDLISVQLGCNDFQVVIDCTTIDIQQYKEYLESDRLFVGWNLKFDLKFLFKHRIIPQRVWDGYLAEKLMYLGFPAGIHSLALKAAGFKYLKVELDKSVRGKIIWAGLTDDVIIYAANDVKYLEAIMNEQIKELTEKDLMTAIDYENRFVFPLSYCEYCGVKLDVDKWKAKMQKDQERVDSALDKLNQWFLQHEPKSKYVVVNNQGDLFSGFDLTPKVTINWNSAKQLIPLFRKYGIDVSVADKDTGGTKDSIDAKQLSPQKDKCDLIPIYLDYKEATKVTSTYGQNFLDQINVDGRIHTNYNQMGADTTRITSGGKDKENHVEYVNLLNLPSDAETRACFVAEDGNRWISIDYSGQETYLMASIANDEAIIKELTYGSGDIHSLTAYMSYSEIPRDTPIKEIKKKFHNLRQEAKGIEFAVNYGGNADTIARNKGIPIADATRIYNDYMSGFKGLKAYQDFRRKDWFAKGYILLSEVTGHKAYIFDYELLRKLNNLFTPEFYSAASKYKGLQDKLGKDTQRTIAEELVDLSFNDVENRWGTANAYRQPISFFWRRKADSEKQSINYPIQAAGSFCLRVALIYFFNYLKRHDLLFKVKICVTPYDEVNCEAPEEIAETIVDVLYKCMVKAGTFFCTRCKLDADVSRLDDGTLPTYWIH